MADLGTLFTISDKVFQLLQSPVLIGMKDWESDVEKLNKSVSFIKNMLLDDLFDEVITIAKRKELNEGAKFSKKISDKVSRFFSSKNPILVSYKTSQEVKNIQQKLNDIARDHNRYDFKVDPKATLERREDTCSFLNAIDENIIGRDDDTEALVDMLLDPTVEENVGFVVVVGIGGLGKTALARLVYNHDRVKSKFDKNLWVCVSTMQSMQLKFREELENKTYLLILDDVWTEDPIEWSNLRKYLTIGGRGSRVIVTTRSEKTAEVVLGIGAHSNKFMLKGLSDEYSWRLFALTAFQTESDEANDLELVKIGKIIVKKCSNVPLAIKVLGTLLYGQTDRWESFVKNRLSEIETTKNPIMSILKLSYNNLEPSLKNCFRYCALFPKDHVMEKQELISLWVAQGYIDDSEDHFLILLKRCFFQDVKQNICGDVSFKMHDLMHDVAQEVAGDEIVVANCLTNNLGKTTRHLFLRGEELTKTSFSKRNIRSCYMTTEINSNLMKTLVANWGCLRTLRLYVPHAERLSESIGDLLHLRYLDLSRSRNLITLPKSVTKLYNLQSLILRFCHRLKEWPEGFYKLVNLRHLDIFNCTDLTCMPVGVDQLTNLRVLTDFKVGKVCSGGKQSGGQLKDLKFLVNLRGCINIIIGENLASEQENEWEGGCLEHMMNLKRVTIHLPLKLDEPIDKEIVAENEAVVAMLQPYRNLEWLYFQRYYGSEIPRWGRAEDDWATILPNLVEIKLEDCKRLHSLPLLSNLKHLRSLILSGFDNLEYMANNGISNGSSGSKIIPFFPSLRFLRIFNMKKLKGWWKEVGESDSSSSCPPRQQPFPLLSELKIEFCPELKFIPSCPSLETLEVKRSNKSLRILAGEDTGNSDLELRVDIDSVGYLTTLPAGRLSAIQIICDGEVERLGEIEEVFKRCCLSLRKLKIDGCTKLRSFSGGLEHLTALESLSLSYGR